MQSSIPGSYWFHADDFQGEKSVPRPASFGNTHTQTKWSETRHSEGAFRWGWICNSNSGEKLRSFPQFPQYHANIANTELSFFYCWSFLDDQATSFTDNYQMVIPSSPCEALGATPPKSHSGESVEKLHGKMHFTLIFSLFMEKYYHFCGDVQLDVKIYWL